MTRFYTYCYLSLDGKPYYIGKGSGKRAWSRHSCEVPTKDRIIILKQNLTEEEAYKHEIYMIAVLGDILINKAKGGGRNCGWSHSQETKDTIGRKNKGKKPTPLALSRAALKRRKEITLLSPKNSIVTFESSTVAAEHIGCSRGAISNVICRRRRQIAGWRVA